MISENRFLGINADDAARDLNPGEYRQARNVLPPLRGLSSSAQLQTVPGMKELTAILPSGSNKCIGYVEDEPNNRIFYMIWNENSNHQIYEYSSSGGTITPVLGKPELNFQEDKLLKGGAVVDGILYFNDGYNEIFAINIDDAKAGRYFNAQQKDLYLIKPMPLEVCTVTPGSDANIAVNRLLDDFFQFTVRFKMRDGTYTPFAPLTVSQWRNQHTEQSGTANYYDVTYTTVFPERLTIEEVEFAFMKNGDGIYSIFDRQVVTSGNIFTSRFYNNNVLETVSDDDAYQPFEFIPRKASYIDVFKNRMFVIDTLSGYNIDGITSLSISEETTTPTLYGERYYKGWGKYKFGVVYYDDFGRSSGVKGAVEYNVGPDIVSGTQLNHILGAKRLLFSLNGNAPEWATKYQIVRTPNLNQSLYVQCPVNVHFWVRDSLSIAASGTQQEFQGNIYLQDRPADDTTWEKLALQLPKNIPVLPDQNWYVRLVGAHGDASGGEFQKVFRVDDNFVLVEDFITTDGKWDDLDQAIYVEFFTTTDTESEIFYEFGEVYDVPDNDTNLISVTDQVLGGGDAYFIDFDLTTGTDYYFTYDDAWVAPGWDTSGLISEELITAWSPTPYFSGNETTLEGSLTYLENGERITRKFVDINREELIGEVKRVDADYAGSKDLFRRTRKTLRANTIKTLDYSKVGDSKGRPHIVISDESEINGVNTVRYSDIFVQNSKFNGLAKFRPLNAYDLPIDSGPCRVVVGAYGNVLLAIHEREVNSLYVGENVIITGDGQDVITSSDQVIGHDRRMAFRYGTIDPESIVQHDNQTYFFDRYNGEVVKITNEGITPLARSYKNATGIINVSNNAYEASRVEASMGYDPFSDMVFFTPKIFDSTQIFTGIVLADGTLLIDADIVAGKKYRIDIEGDEQVTIGTGEEEIWDVVGSEVQLSNTTTGTISGTWFKDQRYRIRFDTDPSVTLTLRLGDENGTIIYSGSASTTVTFQEFVPDADYLGIYYSASGQMTEFNYTLYSAKSNTTTTFFQNSNGSSTTLVRASENTNSLFVTNRGGSTPVTVSVSGISETILNDIILNPGREYLVPTKVLNGQQYDIDLSGEDGGEIIIGYSEDQTWATINSGVVENGDQLGFPMVSGEKYRIRFSGVTAVGNQITFRYGASQTVIDTAILYQDDQYIYFESSFDDTLISFEMPASAAATVVLQQLVGDIAELDTTCNITGDAWISFGTDLVTSEKTLGTPIRYQLLQASSLQGEFIFPGDTSYIEIGDTLRYRYTPPYLASGLAFTQEAIFEIGYAKYVSQSSVLNGDFRRIAEIRIGNYSSNPLTTPRSAIGTYDDHINVEFTVDSSFLDADGEELDIVIRNTQFGTSAISSTISNIRDVALEKAISVDTDELCDGVTFTATQNSEYLYIDTAFLTENVTLRITDLDSPSEAAIQETWGFSEIRDRWIGQYDFFPERYAQVNDRLLCWQEGKLYEMFTDDVNQNVFFGLPYDSSITFVVNDYPSLEKVWQWIMQDADEPWSVVLKSEDGQTDVLSSEMIRRDNVYYADYRRDLNTPADQLDEGQTALLHGRLMKGRVAEVTLSKEVTLLETVSVLSSAFCGWQPVSGHLINRQNQKRN